MQRDVRPQPRVPKCGGAPVVANMSDCRDSPQHSTIEGRALFLVLEAEAGGGRGKLVVYEDLYTKISLKIFGGMRQLRMSALWRLPTMRNGPA